jgi:hypothetical protein
MIPDCRNKEPPRSGLLRSTRELLARLATGRLVVSAEFLADDPASSTPFHWPVSAQLFLPESWTQDDERRKQARVPEEISQHTKPEIALGLLDRARLWGVPIQAVVVDAGYGDNPNFLRGLDARQVPYMCAVESTDLLPFARRGCRYCCPDARLRWAWSTAQAPSCAPVHRQRVDRSATCLCLANHQLARGHERHHADPGCGYPGPLGHWFCFA